MTSPPFKVKAVYEYTSPHDDDLNFKDGQIITVTEEEDADWYVGEYADASGEQKSGLFPRNFVEKYEPAPPPRPNRASRPKPTEPVPEKAPAPEEPSEPPIVLATKPEPVKEEPVAAPQEIPAPVPLASPQREEPEIKYEPAPAPKPVPAAPTQSEAPAPPVEKKPPPVAAKSNAFKDRIAAFNKTAAPPIAPFKPGGSSSTTFIKKPFVAPPPSRDAYVPPPRDAPTQKLYKRDEDPEIAERRAQDQEIAEKAGLVGDAANEGGEDAPKPQSLKERIALLQKQQMEQAAKRSESTQKEKPKRPPKKRVESHDKDTPQATSVEPEPTASADAPMSSDEPHEHAHQPALTRMTSKTSKPSEPRDREPVSDGNDADQSGLGDTTEDAGETSTGLDDEEVEPKAPGKVPQPAATAQQADVGDEEDTTEDDMDEEAQRQLALRERMAKLSGGMGMAGMFGMPAPAGAPKKKKPSEKILEEEAEPAPAPSSAPRVPMIPIPGMGAPRAPEEPSESSPAHDEDDDDDAETIAQEEPPSRPSLAQDRGAPPPVPTQERPAPPPVPSDRPKAEATPIEPPRSLIQSPSAGSESDDEMPQSSGDNSLPLRGAPPPIPTASIPPMPSRPQGQSTPKRTSVHSPLAMSPTSPGGSGRVPVFPMGGMPSATASRPPPPPPPGAPPSRQGTSESLSRSIAGGDGVEGESEYEGDYDTDIASGAKHKDALKAHIREPSIDGSTVADDNSTRGAPPLPPIHRAVPPPPPQQAPPRRSVDGPRAPPPPVPPPRDTLAEEEEYDPYKYTSPTSRPVPSRAAPPPAPVGPPPPPAPQATPREEDDEDDLYGAPPPRKSVDRPPPPPPQSPPVHQHPIPHLPQGHAPPPPAAVPAAPGRSSSRAAPRPSQDIEQPPSHSRKSTDVSRQSHDQSYMARDVDLDRATLWYSHPNGLPPSLQTRRDVLIEHGERSTAQRGDKTIASRDIFVLYPDYSQTTISTRYNVAHAPDCRLDQRHDPPPPPPRQDALEAAHATFGAKIADDVAHKANALIGDGTPLALIYELFRPHATALPPIGARSFGVPIYTNLANSSVAQSDEIRPGDIITFRNAKFQGKHGAMHAKYTAEVGMGGLHAAVVIEWDGTKKKVRGYEQVAEGKKGKVRAESWRVGDLRSGEVKVWRVVGRDWVGWE
ncbi:hypothetical protein P152DRAFT_442178 [Eremomyces bilateralis CBS 781.70]|uniref:SH3 domain-containing protein n=1 Tax=Eremomyces bilateralis CBS 781.70 TaxID=1392243 RepID=A0A6G1FU15_9PEZI|nr:uncharacterized protein P152DRAFT_442178 [Eremomyces bilateralis CBS 781.70]KAF1809264.1 hypothetical protein P152DRAFT_442178 [Eremomyces bilateralis CBS 781.70]